jgi:predicted N-acetyltransferase YhbS
MSVADVVYLPEEPAHDPEIELINEEAFGPGRFARAAYKIREGGPHERSLSFVALSNGTVVASVRLTPIAAGAGRGLLLGPLAVRPAHKNFGIGKKLVRISLEEAAKAGWGVVVLVGDAPYYGPLGFSRVASGQIVMPRPVDPHRLLAHEIAPGALAGMKGAVVHAALAECSVPNAETRAAMEESRTMMSEQRR